MAGEMVRSLSLVSELNLKGVSSPGRLKRCLVSGAQSRHGSFMVQLWSLCVHLHLPAENRYSYPSQASSRSSLGSGFENSRNAKDSGKETRNPTVKISELQRRLKPRSLNSLAGEGVGCMRMAFQS